jgi:outer membrane protein OmpA-like peptidoglycan-associated protein
MLGRPVALVLLVAALSACNSGTSSSSATSSATTERVVQTTTTNPDDESTTEPDESSTTTATDDDSTSTLPAGQRPGPIDLNEDGVGDPMCGQHDYGAGLVLQLFCDATGYTGEVPGGVTLTDTSLYRFPTSSKLSMDGISGELVQAADPSDALVYVIVFHSDALFATGGSKIVAADTFDNVVKLVNSSFPQARLQLRGHTDSTGDPGSNKTLAEARANSVKAYLTGHGVHAAEVTTTGFGETQPLALEDTDAGKEFNRRVELVIRPAA